MSTPISHRIPNGAGALFLIQIFSTIAFAVLYSTLELYMLEALHMKTIEANAILGGFLAFNYGLHLLGGYFGGRFLSYRGLFILGMILQLIGCGLLAQTENSVLYWGLGFYLTGNGLNITCINMMVTQLFAPEDKHREAAFLWNYSGMNIGFFIGYSLAGYFQLTHDYQRLFLLTCLGSVTAIIIVLLNWSKLADRVTLVAKSSSKEYAKRMSMGFLLVIIMVPITKTLLMHASMSNQLVLLVGILMAFIMINLASRQAKEARNKMFAYIILALASLVFWALYQIAPIGLTVFAEYNVNLNILGFGLTPQWVQNINTLVIVFGGPLMALFLRHIRQKGMVFSIPHQFTSAMFAIGAGFILLPIGIKYADPQGLSDFSWLLASYVLQSIGELLISPIGFAMIGQLAPVELSGIMMGTWMMMSGIGGVLSSYSSDWAIGNANVTNPLITNPNYAHVFSALGWGAVLCGLILYILIPLLRKLINEPALTP